LTFVRVVVSGAAAAGLSDAVIAQHTAGHFPGAKPAAFIARQIILRHGGDVF
jgi:hypothetical protein